jgi:hypothetical protein
MNAEWLRMKEEMAYRKIVVAYNNVTKLRGLWKFCLGLDVSGKMRLVTKEEEQSMKGCDYFK